MNKNIIDNKANISTFKNNIQRSYINVIVLNIIMQQRNKTFEVFCLRIYYKNWYEFIDKENIISVILCCTYFIPFYLHMTFIINW